MVHDLLDPTGAFSELAGVIRSSDTTAALLREVVMLAQRRIPGAGDVSVTLVRNRLPATVAATGTLATDLDESQYQQGYGPCLDAGRTDATILVADWEREDRWPEFGKRARALQLGSSLSLPLPVESYLLGAINVYAMPADAFDEDAVGFAEALAAHLTVWLGFAETANFERARAVNLERALESRAVIDQAKGIIMMQQKCSAEAAFQQLRQASMDHNIELAVLAGDLVASASSHPVTARPATAG